MEKVTETVESLNYGGGVQLIIKGLNLPPSLNKIGLMYLPNIYGENVTLATPVPWGSNGNRRA